MPLAGVRVTDLTRFVSGSYCTMLMSAMGADVVKVEGLPGGDPYREHTASTVGGIASLFAALNAGKRSVAVDLRRPEGLEVVRRLVAGSDVFVENSRPGSLKRSGLDPETLAAVNPRLVYASVSGYGQVGPDAGRGGFDLIVQAAGGLMSVTGQPDGPPTKVGTPVLDIGAGISTLAAVLAALLARATDGRGRHVTSSLLEFAASAFTSYATQALTTGMPPGRLGNDSPQFAPYGVFRCADGEIVLAGAGSEDLWRRLCGVLDRPEWVADERFCDNAARLENRSELAAAIEDVLGTQPAAHWRERCDAAGVPAESVHDVLDALGSPQAIALGLVQIVGSGSDSSYPVVRPPFGVGGPLGYPRPAPRLGQDSGAVLADLGYGQDEIAALVGAGVVASR